MEISQLAWWPQFTQPWPFGWKHSPKMAPRAISAWPASSVLMGTSRPTQHQFLMHQGSACAEFSVLNPLLPQFYPLNFDFSCMSSSFLLLRWPYNLLRHVDMLHICLHQQDLSHTLSPVNTILLNTCVLKWTENSWHQYFSLQKVCRLHLCTSKQLFRLSKPHHRFLSFKELYFFFSSLPFEYYLCRECKMPSNLHFPVYTLLHPVHLLA